MVDNQVNSGKKLIQYRGAFSEGRVYSEELKLELTLHTSCLLLRIGEKML